MQAAIAATIRQLPSRPQPLAQVYREHLETYVLADELGFAHLWLAEHHFADDQHNCSAMPILAAVALYVGYASETAADPARWQTIAGVLGGAALMVLVLGILRRRR